jgi:cell division protease FtsH
MDPDIGPICYHDTTEQEYRFAKAYSEKTAELIDKKIKTYLTDAYEKAKQIILDKKDLLDRMVVDLLEKEFLTREEFLELVTE